VSELHQRPFRRHDSRYVAPYRFVVQSYVKHSKLAAAAYWIMEPTISYTPKTLNEQAC
jgi:hypothetical protein